MLFYIIHTEATRVISGAIHSKSKLCLLNPGVFDTIYFVLIENFKTMFFSRRMNKDFANVMHAQNYAFLALLGGFVVLAAVFEFQKQKTF